MSIPAGFFEVALINIHTNECVFINIYTYEDAFIKYSVNESEWSLLARVSK
jgi:hypothetical protein